MKFVPKFRVLVEMPLPSHDIYGIIAIFGKEEKEGKDGDKSEVGVAHCLGRVQGSRVHRVG